MSREFPQSDARSFPIPQFIGIAMLAWALVPSNPYGYYILLRIVVCGICVFFAIKASDLQKVGWTWTLGVTAVIYNPIVRIHLNRDIWSVVNVATIALLVGTIFALREAQSSKSMLAGDGNP